MKSTFLLITTLLTMSINLSFAQGKAIDIRYKGGSLELGNFLAQNLKYPVLSQENRTVGYSITSITITPEGKISEVSSINPIDNFIDEDIKRVIKMTQNKWLKSDSISTNQTFYIQIVYIIGLYGNTPTINDPVKNNFNFMEPVVLMASVFKNEFLPDSDEYIATRYSECMKNGDYAEALKCVTELIKRNPFNKKLYQSRISINNIQKRNDLIIQDVQKMQNFIPGVTLDELIN